MEDESRMIGRIVQPESLFKKLRESPVVLLEEPLSVRIENTLQEYVIRPLLLDAAESVYTELENASRRIEKKLGGARTSEVLNDIKIAKLQWITHNDVGANRIWIEKLLVWYYDPLYHNSFSKRNPPILTQGSSIQIEKYLQTKTGPASRAATC